MDNENKVLYYLVVEARPREFMPIDINILEGTNNFYNSLELIDMFTKKYSYEEIMKMVLENNLLPINFLNGSLCIINNKNYRFQLLTKDNNMSLDDFFFNNINDKQIMNKFYNIFLKYVKDDEIIIELKKYLIEKNIVGILEILYSLNYEKIRSIYLYLEKINVKTEKRVLKND
ncbi:MAG: hypothetical protein PUD07_02290 [bacterium]|nr:hypothetical protein [bacterium]